MNYYSLWHLRLMKIALFIGSFILPMSQLLGRYWSGAKEPIQQPTINEAVKTNATIPNELITNYPIFRHIFRHFPSRIEVKTASSHATPCINGDELGPVNWEN